MSLIIMVLKLNASQPLIPFTTFPAAVAPPGYYSDGSALQLCSNGTYATGWARRTSCTSCGTSIYSEARSANEWAGTGLVRAAPTDCCK
jgi:hypothetical protein